MAAAAIPFALKAAPYAASVLGGLFGKKLSGPSSTQQAGVAGTQGSAAALSGQVNPLLQQGANLTAGGQGSLGAASDYYKNILGDRNAATNAIAPETTQALDYYKGSEGKINETMRGGARDTAIAELERQKVGQIAGYLPAARANAAAGATQVGAAQVGAGNAASGQGVNAAANSGYLSNQLFNQGTTIANQQQAGGNAMGKMIFSILNGMGKGKGSGSGISPTTLFSGGMAGI